MQLRVIINHFVNDYSNYLNSLGNATPSQLKSEVAKSHRYGLIKSLTVMKKFIGWSILIIVLAMTLGTGIVVNDSRTYFKSFFEVERQKLNLRSEKSVDSLVNVIIIKTKTLDSLKIENDSYLTYVHECQKFNADLQNTITVQTQMIKNYNTEHLKILKQ